MPRLLQQRATPNQGAPPGAGQAPVVAEEGGKGAQAGPLAVAGKRTLITRPQQPGAFAQARVAGAWSRMRSTRRSPALAGRRRSASSACGGTVQPKFLDERLQHRQHGQRQPIASGKLRRGHSISAPRAAGRRHRPAQSTSPRWRSCRRTEFIGGAERGERDRRQRQRHSRGMLVQGCSAHGAAGMRCQPSHTACDWELTMRCPGVHNRNSALNRCGAAGSGCHPRWWSVCSVWPATAAGVTSTGGEIGRSAVSG